MSNHDFRNDASWAEWVDQLRQSRPSTFFQEQLKAKRLDGSTNYEATRDLIQTGESAATLYPRLPDSSPWSGAGAQVPPEPPLGPDHLEVTGEAHEIAVSLNDPVSPFNRQMDGEAGAPATLPPVAVAGVATCVALPVAQEAELLLADPAPLGSVPPAASSPAADRRSGSAIPSDTGARLGELLDRGLVRVKRRRL